MVAQGGSAPSPPPRKKRRAVFIMRHGEREDYAWKAQGRNWQQAHSRPWDTPLTANGHLQGAAGGRAVAAHCARLGLQPVRHVLVSPLLRCAQTGSAAAKARIAACRRESLKNGPHVGAPTLSQTPRPEPG